MACAMSACAISTSPAPTPRAGTGQSTPNATHLIKVAVQAALGLRPGMEVFGTDYPTPDGSCLRDYIQVTRPRRAPICDALRHLRGGGENLDCNCGYERGYSVLEVVETVKKVSGVDFPVKISGRRPGDPAAIVAANERIRENWAGRRSTTISKRSSGRRCAGRRSWRKKKRQRKPDGGDASADDGNRRTPDQRRCRRRRKVGQIPSVYRMAPPCGPAPISAMNLGVPRHVCGSLRLGIRP